MSTGSGKPASVDWISIDAAGLGNRRSRVPLVCWTQTLSESSVDRLQISKSKRSALGVAIICTVTGSADSTRARPIDTFISATSSCRKIVRATTIAISKNALAGNTTLPKTR